MSKPVTGTVLRRLLPLYAASFFHGFVFWYTIEKLFMRSIGFSDASIGTMVAVYSAVMLVVETPSGILADRWSRKGVLILASLALATAGLLGGLSNSLPVYIISTSFWGIFFALYSGTYDSIVYDTLYEETKSSSRYEFYYGRVKIMDSTALVISSLLGGVIANYIGLRAAYFLTLPFCLLAIVALVLFKEPRLHKLDVAVPIKKHITNTFGAVVRNKELLPIVLALILTSVCMYILFEFSQLWYLALAAPVVAFGPAHATLLTSTGLGGLAGSYLKLHKYSVLLGMLGIMLACSVGLVVLRSIPLIVLCLVVLCTALIGNTLLFSRLLHDSLSSNIRAGAASAVSTASRLLIIPIALVFGYISNTYGIFTASWMVVALIMVVSLLIISAAKKNGRTGLVPVKHS